MICRFWPIEFVRRAMVVCRKSAPILYAARFEQRRLSTETIGKASDPSFFHVQRPAGRISPTASYFGEAQGYPFKSRWARLRIQVLAKGKQFAQSPLGIVEYERELALTVAVSGRVRERRSQNCQSALRPHCRRIGSGWMADTQLQVSAQTRTCRPAVIPHRGGLVDRRGFG